MTSRGRALRTAILVGIAFLGTLVFLIVRARRSPAESELGYTMIETSPGGSFDAARVYWTTDWEMMNNIAIAPVRPGVEERAWTIVFPSWPHLRYGDMHWESDAVLVVTCKDDTWFGVREDTCVAKLGVTVRLEKRR